MIENYVDLVHEEKAVVSWTVVQAAMSPRGKYLCIGPGTVPLVESMAGKGSKGYFVTADSDQYPFDVEVIRCVLGNDPKFVKTTAGHWTRAVTMREIFNQFGIEWFDVICIMDTGRDRELWLTPQVQAVLPSVYVLSEDGHNEGVIKMANDRGYDCTVCTDALVMVHQ